MNRLLLLLLLLFAAITGRAQNKTLIKGTITDSLNHEPVEYATVAVLDARDTTTVLLSYTLSDKKGDFILYNVPAGIPLKVLISYVGYQPYRKFFTLKKNETHDMGAIFLSSKQLQEVTIRGERIPITVRKDTVEFLAEAFKVRPNAVVEDLLKKLPGIEVTYDGNITMMGKEVTKILVDGREFFASDISIASKNLDADLIDKVQVYDDRENDPDHRIPESKVKKIINLKFKKALKKSIFGKIYAGGGTQDHYQVGGLFNMFRDTLQVSLLGFNNNLNNTGFGSTDLYQNAGLNRGGDAFYRGGLSSLGNSGPEGKQTVTAGGVNINTDYGKKLKINLTYLYKRTVTDYSTLSKSQQFLNDTVITSNNERKRTAIQNSNYLTGLVEWRPDDVTDLRYDPSLSITPNTEVNNSVSRNYSNFIDSINNTSTGTNLSSNILQFQHSLTYHRQFANQGSLNVNHNLAFNPGSSINYRNNNVASYLPSFPSYAQTLEDMNINRSFDASVNARYLYPFSKKLTAEVTINGDYNNQINKASIYNYNPITGQYDSLLVMQSSDLVRKLFTKSIVPGITYKFPKDIILQAYLTAQVRQVTNVFNRNTPNIDQHFFDLLPNVSLNISNLYFSYSKGVDLPNIGDMIPYTVVSSPQYSVTGNPNLKPTVRNTFNVGYNKYDFQKGNSFRIGGQASFEKNSVLRENTIDSDLVQTSMPINRNGRYTSSAYATIGRRIKKTKNFTFTSSTTFNLNTSHNFYILNYQNGYQDNYNASVSQVFTLSWKDLIEFYPQYTINKTYTTYQGLGIHNQNYMRHNVNAHLVLYWPQRMNLDAYYNYVYNPLVPDGFQKSSNVLNLSLAREFLKKDRGEIKLSCYDILNQNVSTTRIAANNYISDTQSQIIKRYFMLTLQFKFNKTSLKK